MRDAIAIDFDGCLCVNAYPGIGAPNWAVIAKAKERQAAGAGLILWTCREGLLLRAAVQACREWGLTFDAINESLPDWIEAFGNRPRKVGATEYWDDRAVRVPENDWRTSSCRKFLSQQFKASAKTVFCTSAHEMRELIK